MSTKRLDRTAISGGRITGYKYERKQSLKNHRRGCNALLQASRNPAEDFLEIDFPERQHSSYWDGEKFNDKIAPVKRWLEKQVGKVWDDVYSLLRNKFDSRTTAGRHIVFDHLLRDVWTSQDRSTLQAQYSEYYVDGYGILCKNKKYPHQYFNRGDYNRMMAERRQLGYWLQGWLVDKIGNVLYWFEPTVTVPNPIHFNYETFSFYYDPEFDQHGRLLRRKTFRAPYRQGKRLSGADVEFFSKLLQRNKDWLLANSPLKKDYRGFWYGRG